MKLNNVEVTGITTLIIHTPLENGNTTTVVFKQREDKLWVREGVPSDVHKHTEIVNKIKGFTNSPYYKVWINGNVINILPQW